MNEHSNFLLSQILSEQVKQTRLLEQMVGHQSRMLQLLEGSDPQAVEGQSEAKPVPTYLDGSPCL
ncbi:hypothetical protein ALQ72_01098 [Pseudomonas syringae pv. maculicola]|uniref:hypothetical protein n=1 Tax=Pseudomonas syringae group genomosp. 3 TaxID=251701 RepID=UPI0006B88C61|nr:hypothetical protein [Pseudomonas syringae group genomosp. 3]KPB96509.1 Uncharacterized protein AC503_1478 [Pseudomonas syringae pv. maculicola]MBM0211862.1 hypothetical protein [Pseudomonas syringae pv. maculicola]RMM83786.1 hypothetical protein ALQ72_01098 [Pseudomonas syringae pv. maculicola]